MPYGMQISEKLQNMTYQVEGTLAGENFDDITTKIL